MKVTVTTIALMLATLGVAFADVAAKTDSPAAQPTSFNRAADPLDEQYKAIIENMSDDAKDCFMKNQKLCQTDPQKCVECFGNQEKVQGDTEKCTQDCMKKGGDSISCASSCLAMVLKKEQPTSSTTSSSATKSSSETKSAKATASIDGENDAASLASLSVVAAVPLLL
ncbi:hypothetical protein IWQ62_004548, partial [Dispira parvispora]